MSDRESFVDAEMGGYAEDRLREELRGGRTPGMRRSEARPSVRLSGIPEEKPAEPRTEGPAMAPAFERILSRTFAIDVLRIADELDGQLAVPDADRVDYGVIARRVGEASENARKAHLLYVNAEAAKAEFEARVATTTASIRARAHESLAALEAAGKLGKKKTITNDDVEAEMARIAPDEFERVAVKRRRVELMVEQLRREAELHKHFPHTVEALLTTSRSPSR
jgi:hypothetical protein